MALRDTDWIELGKVGMALMFRELSTRVRSEAGKRAGSVVKAGALAKVSALMLGAKEPWIDVSEAQFATNKFKAPMQF